MKRIAAFTLYCLLIFPNIAQADNVIEFDDLLYAPDDSLRSKQLSGVEVMGEREWIENGIINCIPTKAEKRLSNSPASLIKTMHLTYLKEKDGGIVNLMGEVVPVFHQWEKGKPNRLGNLLAEGGKAGAVSGASCRPTLRGSECCCQFHHARIQGGRRDAGEFVSAVSEQWLLHGYIEIGA